MAKAKEEAEKKATKKKAKKIRCRYLTALAGNPPNQRRKGATEELDEEVAERYLSAGIVEIVED